MLRLQKISDKKTIYVKSIILTLIHVYIVWLWTFDFRSAIGK